MKSSVDALREKIENVKPGTRSQSGNYVKKTDYDKDRAEYVKKKSKDPFVLLSVYGKYVRSHGDIFERFKILTYGSIATFDTAIKFLKKAQVINVTEDRLGQEIETWLNSAPDSHNPLVKLWLLLLFFLKVSCVCC